jgi:hypothetical protein
MYLYVCKSLFVKYKFPDEEFIVFNFLPFCSLSERETEIPELETINELNFSILSIFLPEIL